MRVRGQWGIRKPGRFRSATPNSSELAPVVGVITPNVFRLVKAGKIERADREGSENRRRNEEEENKQERSKKKK
jgi:hypothetical protein